MQKQWRVLHIFATSSYLIHLWLVLNLWEFLYNSMISLLKINIIFYLHSAVDAADWRDLVCSVASNAATQSTDQCLIFLTVQTQGIMVLVACLWRALTWFTDLPQGIHNASQCHIRWRAVAIHCTATHRTLELPQRIHAHRAHTATAVRVATLQHKRLREDLQAHRATQLLL